MNRKRSLLIIFLLVSSALPLLITVPMAEASELVVSISHTYDDVWMTEAGNVFSNTFMVMMLDNEIGIQSFIRFRDLEISKSARINYATLKVYVAETQDTPDPGSSVTIYGIDEPDCAPFTSDGSLWSLSRPYTSASVNWNTSVWAGYRSVNVTDIVKEIINQYAWEFGNSLGLQILGASDSGQWPRSFEDYYHAYHEGQAELTIVYDVAEGEDPPEDEVDFIEQYGDYTIWRKNGSGGVFFKDIVISGSPDGALEDYYIPIKAELLAPFATNGKHDPLYFSNSPSSAYYNGFTYIAWQGDSGYDPYIIAYNHSSDTFSDQVELGTNPLAGDSHGAPVIMIDNQSYLHVFYGAHNSNLIYSKSDNPEDITAWTLQASPTGGCTYPVPIYADDKIYLLYRETDLSRAYRISDDNGASWGAENTIIQVANPGNHYIYTTMAELYGTKIHMTWRYLINPGDPRDLFHAYLETADGHMYSMDGTDLGTTITTAEADANCLVVDSGAFDMRQMAIHLDGDGKPYIIYNIETVASWDFRFTRWTGANWIGSVTLTETDNDLNAMDFIVYSSTNITAWLVTPGEAGRGGDIDRWTLSGTTWTERDSLLTEAIAGVGLFDPKVVFNYDDELKLIFTEYGGEGAGNLRLYASDGTTLLQVGEDVGRLVHLNALGKADFGDVRFTNYNGVSQIDHWLEESQNGSYALYWVKVPDIPASPDNVTLRIYWGDLDAVSASIEAREDFTTYTEVEEADDIQKTTYHVDFADRRDRTTYLYKDYTVGFFGDFAEHLNIKRVTHAPASINYQIIMAKVVSGEKQMRDNHDEHIAISVGGDDPKISVYEWDDGGNSHASTPPTTGELTLGTWYYLSVRKDNVSLIVDTYTSADLRHAMGDGDFEHQNLTLTTDYSFNITYVGNSYDSGTAQAGSSDMESQFFRSYVENEPSIGAWGNLTGDGGLDEYFILDENGTLVDLNGNFTDLDDAEDALDDYTGGDPMDPDPGTQGWDTEGPWTRFKTRLYVLFIGLGCLFTPLWAMAYKKFDAVGYAGCFIIMVTGVGLLWSITGI